MPAQAQIKSRDEAYEMIGEIVGKKFDEMQTQIKDVQSDAIKQLADILGAREEPKAKSFRSLPVEERRRSAKNFLAALFVTKGKADPDGKFSKAEKIARDTFDDEYAAKALGTTTLADGGILVDPEFAPEVLAVLRAKTVVLESGARVVPMDSGSLHLKRGSTGATAAYRGESVATSASQQALADVELKAKILDVMTPAANQLLSRSDTARDFIQEDLVAAAKDTMDSKFIRGDGTQDTPTGLRNLVAAANLLTATNAAATADGSTTAEIIKDIARMIRTMADDNIPMVRVGWLWAPRTWQKFATMLTADGDFIFRDEVGKGSLYGFPWKMTTNIPINLNVGGSSDDTEVYLVDFFDIIVGETETLTLEVSEHASYTVSGSLVSAFERGETLIKVTMEHDIAARRGGNEIVVLQTVRWSA